MRFFRQNELVMEMLLVALMPFLSVGWRKEPVNASTINKKQKDSKKEKVLCVEKIL